MLEARQDHRPSAEPPLTGSCGPCRILAQKKAVRPPRLEGVSELRGSHAQSPPKYLSKIARTSVADFERDFDEAAGCFADRLRRLQHALSGDELQRRQSRW